MSESLDILLAEDDVDQADPAEMILTGEGWNVLRAQDGEQALRLLRNHQPRVILLDIVMPRLDGFGLLKALGPASRKQPIIAMSSFPEFLPQALGMGAVATLAKPFNADALVRAVRGVMAGTVQAAPAAQETSAALPGLTAGSDLDELRRLERLHRLQIMEEEPDAVLDAVARLTAELLRVPIALISLITEDRQWWKAMCGIEGDLAKARGTPREISFCSHAVAARAPLIVADAKEHPVFSWNPMVRSGQVRAYAGVPLEIPGVGAVGTLCVVDSQSRIFTTGDISLLVFLAQRVAAEIEWRERQASPGRPLGTYRYLSMMDEVHGIYNASSFRTFADILVRQALEREENIAIVALQRLPRSHGRAEHPEDLSALIQVLRLTTEGERSILGWLDEDAVASICPELDEAQAQHRLDAAVVAEATWRREGPEYSLPQVVGSVAASRGAFRADILLRSVRRNIDHALLRHQALSAVQPPTYQI